MDSHYDQVMQQRDQTSTGPARRYFSRTPTILDRAAFDQWKQEHSYGFFQLPEGRLAEAVGVGLVYDFPSRWWSGRGGGAGGPGGGEGARRAVRDRAEGLAHRPAQGGRGDRDVRGAGGPRPRRRRGAHRHRLRHQPPSGAAWTGR